MRRVRRWGRRVSVALAASMGIQAAIVVLPRSWFFSRGALDKASTGVILSEEGQLWLVDVFDTGPWGQVVYAQTDYRDLDPTSDQDRWRTAVRVSASFVPGWASLRRAQPAGATPFGPEWRGYWLEERAEGWPWRSVRGEKHTLHRAAQGTRQGWQAEVHRRGYLKLSDDVWLLVLPIWRGLLLDVTVLAVPFVIVQWSAGAWRASRRRRRGRCPVCNYDREGIAAESACPECGELLRG